MALELVGGVLLGAAVGELLKAVIDAKEKASSFRDSLTCLESTLISTIPHLDEISRLHNKFDLCQQEMQELVTLVSNGKTLVLKFSKEILVVVKRLEMKLVGDENDGRIENHQIKSSGKHPNKETGSGVQDSKNEETQKLYTEEAVKLEEGVVKCYEESKNEEVLKSYNDFMEVETVKLYEDSKLEEAVNKLCEYYQKRFYEDSKEGQEAVKLYNDSKQKEDKKMYEDFKQDHEDVKSYEDFEKDETMNSSDQDSNKEEAVKLYPENVEKKQYQDVCPCNFDLEDLLWFEADVLGKGTNGTTYRCNYRKYGFVSVVKILNEVKVEETVFKQQIEYLVKIGQHPNIVPPFGYRFSKSRKLLLYDYAPAGSLYALLQENRETPLNWESRVKISLGIARGISHLHSEGGVKFIHGNIKPSNVILTRDLDACLSDYGLTNIMRFCAASEYHAPESYFKADQKSDVYSFGIILIEILTGVGPALLDLPNWVNSIGESNWASEIFDKELLLYQNNCVDGMRQMLKIAIQCVGKRSCMRPKMEDVVSMIENIQPPQDPIILL